MSKSTIDESRFNSLYQGLNDAQRQAVDAIEGPVVVNAGPGTGKTQILTLRIANILRLQGADMAPHILALTFTNAGVRAMRERLAGIIGSAAYEVHIFTFHSFAEYILSRYREHFSDLLLAQSLSDTERFALVERLIKESDLEILRPFGAPHYYVPPVIRAIDELKRDNHTPESFREWNEQFKDMLLESEDSYYKRATKEFKKGDLRPDALKKYEKNKELASLFVAYEQALKEEHRYDFNDMILKLVSCMDDNPDLTYELQEQFQYLLVDEHQDTNEAQNAIIKRLIEAEHLDGHPNLFTVGDDKQAIYRFQGASLANFLAFQEQFRDVVVINLEENYRSPQHILDAAHSLISANESGREHQALTAQNNHGALSCHQFPAYTDELHWIAQQIQSQSESGVPFRDIAILYRENRQVGQIQKVLAQHKIPSVILAKEDVLETALVRKIILLLNVVYDITDNAKLAQLLYSDVFDTKGYDVVKIVERFRRNKRNKHTGTKHLYRVLQDKKLLQELELSDVDLYLSIAETLNLAITTFASTHFLAAFDELMRGSSIIVKLLADSDSYNQLRFYDRLYSYLRSLQESQPTLGLEEVLSQFATLEEYNISLDSEPSEHRDEVRLLTAHKAKGLEFPHVYITNVVDKTWGNKSVRKQFEIPVGTTSGEDDDERRLLYVGITRAEETCTLSFSQTAGEKSQSPSRFLYEIDDSLLHWETHEQPTSLADVHAPADESYRSVRVLDDEMIRTIYARRPLSVTALNNYYACPARYFINNLLQIPATYSRTLVYGSLVHKALEEFFSASGEQGAILDKELLLERFDVALDAEYLEETDKKDMRRRAHTGLSGYYDTNSEHWSYHISTELRINGVLLGLPDGSELTLTGALDKLEYDENNEQQVRVIDYKTGKPYSKKSKDEKAALDRQLVFYSLLLSLYREGYYQMHEGVLDFIEPHPEKGSYEQHILQPSAADRQTLVEQIQEMDTAVKAGSSFLQKRCNKSDCEACNMVSQLDL